MRFGLDGILVVEGKEDASYLSSFISSEIVAVNGFELSTSTIDYLKGKRIIALLDPDESGKKIRKILNNQIDNIVNVEIDINKCTRGKKKGVAECQIDEILDKLSPYFSNTSQSKSNISSYDLYRIGLIGSDKELRDYVAGELKIGRCNSKQFLKRLNNNNIAISQVENIIKKYNGNK